jgi:hypothetical protein
MSDYFNGEEGRKQRQRIKEDIRRNLGGKIK